MYSGSYTLETKSIFLAARDEWWLESTNKWTQTWAWAFRHLSCVWWHKTQIYRGPTIANFELIGCCNCGYKLCNVYSNFPFPPDFSPTAHEKPEVLHNYVLFLELTKIWGGIKTLCFMKNIIHHIKINAIATNISPFVSIERLGFWLLVQLSPNIIIHFSR